MPRGIPNKKRKYIRSGKYQKQTPKQTIKQVRALKSAEARVVEGFAGAITDYDRGRNDGIRQGQEDERRLSNL